MRSLISKLLSIAAACAAAGIDCAPVDLAELRLHTRRPEVADALRARADAELGVPAAVAPTAEAAVKDADVVVTVTSAATPLFPATALSDRALICAVGATKYDRCEIGPDVVERCRVVVADDLTGSRTECGDLIQAAAAGRFDWDRAVELHALVGKVPPSAPGPEERPSPSILDDVWLRMWRRLDEEGWGPETVDWHSNRGEDFAVFRPRLDIRWKRPQRHHVRVRVPREVIRQRFVAGCHVQRISVAPQLGRTHPVLGSHTARHQPIDVFD